MRGCASRSTTRRVARRAGELAAADRGDDVETRALRDRRVQPGALAVDVHVDVAAQRRALRDETVAEARPALLELVDGAEHTCRVDFDVARQPGEEWGEGAREPKVGHVSRAPPRRRRKSTANSWRSRSMSLPRRRLP